MAIFVKRNSMHASESLELSQIELGVNRGVEKSFCERLFNPVRAQSVLQSNIGQQRSSFPSRAIIITHQIVLNGYLNKSNQSLFQIRCVVAVKTDQVTEFP